MYSVSAEMSYGDERMDGQTQKTDRRTNMTKIILTTDQLNA